MQKRKLKPEEGESLKTSPQGMCGARVETRASVPTPGIVRCYMEDERHMERGLTLQDAAVSVGAPDTPSTRLGCLLSLASPSPSSCGLFVEADGSPGEPTGLGATS